MKIEKAPKRIYFYEWSDCDNNPINFPNCGTFIKFCEECHIELPHSFEKIFGNVNGDLHCTCIKDTNHVAIGLSRSHLKMLMTLGED